MILPIQCKGIATLPQKLLTTCLVVESTDGRPALQTSGTMKPTGG